MVELLEAVQPKEAAAFQQVRAWKVLTFLGTCRAAGQTASLAVRRLSRLEFDESGHRVDLFLEGRLPRSPEQGELVTASLANLSAIRGYQVKTQEQAIRLPTELCEQGPQGTTLHCPQIFTVHHSPHTQQSFVFEDLPVAQVREDLQPVTHAVVGIGVRANVSPRFLFHYQATAEGLELFHGDGVTRKTFQNLSANPKSAQLILDLTSYRGFLLEGETRAFAAEEFPEAARKIRAGFESAGWGEPSHLFRFQAHSIRPAGPESSAA